MTQRVFTYSTMRWNETPQYVYLKLGRWASSLRIVNSLADHRLLTAQEVAPHLRQSVKTIYRLALRGELPSVLVGRRRLFVESEIENYIIQRGDERGKRRGVAASAG